MALSAMLGGGGDARLSSQQRDEAERTEQDIFANNLRAVQNEKRVILGIAPFNNGLLLILNILCGFGFGFLTFFTGGLGSDISIYIQIAFAVVSGLALGCLMYAASVVGTKLGEAVGFGKTTMYAALFAMLVAASVVTSAFFYILSVESATSTEKAASADAAALREVERTYGAAVTSAQDSLDVWMDRASVSRSALDKAQSDLRAREDALRNWIAAIQNDPVTYPPKSAEYNRRMKVTWPEHATYLREIESAKGAVTDARQEIALVDNGIISQQRTLDEARAAHQRALDAVAAAPPRDSAYEKTMANLGQTIGKTAIGRYFGIHDAQTFITQFGLFLAILLSITPPAWSLLVAWEARPELANNRKWLAGIASAAGEARAAYVSARTGGTVGMGAIAAGAAVAGMGGAPAPAEAAQVHPAPEEYAAPDLSQKARMTASALRGGEETLAPSGLTSGEYGAIKARNMAVLLRMQADAEAGHMKQNRTGIIAIREDYRTPNGLLPEKIARAGQQYLIEIGAAEAKPGGGLELMNSGF